MFDGVPIWALFIGVLLVVLLFIEVGYRMKRRFDRSRTENEALVSVITGAGLGLLGFVLAFIFSIVYVRYETRKELVRQEAAAIRRVWLRSNFMEQPDRAFTVDLLRKYLDIRLQAAQANTSVEIDTAIAQSEVIQRQLWEQGIAKAKGNSLSGMSVPYLQSLNDLIDMHNQRLAIGALDRIPTGVWIVLTIMLLLSMTTIGYFSGMKGANRSLISIILAFSFSLLFVLISALDDPLHGLFVASQQPLMHVQVLMSQ